MNTMTQPQVITQITWLLYLAKLLEIYSFICFIRIFLTWFPKANYSPIGQFLAKICDPYLNLFRKLRFLKIGSLDFSVAFALCVLFAVSTILAGLSSGHPLSFGIILAMLLQLVWSFASSVIKFIIVLLVIRLVIFFIMQKRANGNYSAYDPMWDQIDRFISPVIFKISGTIFRRMVSFTRALLTSIIVGIMGVLILDRLMQLFCFLLANLPF